VALIPSTTTSSPSTTTNPAATTEADVRAAVSLAEQTYSACLMAMPHCDPETLAVARAGGLLDRNTTRIRQWNAAGYTIRDRQRFRYVVEQITLQNGEKQASVQVCIADGSALVKPAEGPGGADVIVDDSFVSGRSMWDMRLDADGRWRAYDAPASGPTEARDVCPAA
jgi:hypothetical protein